MAKPTPKETTVSISYGGKVQLVKFELSSDYRAHIGGTWDVEGMTDAEVEAFRYEKLLELKSELEPVIQAELDDLFQQKQELNG